MNDVKKQALEEMRDIIAERQKKRIDNYAKGLSTLKSSPVEIMTDPLEDHDKMKVKSGSDWADEIEMKRKIRREMEGKVAEKVGDTLDYKQLRKQAMKAGRKGLKALPLVGPMIGLMGAEDASAALPILGDAESAGQSKEAEMELLGRAQGIQGYANSQARKDKLRKLAELKK